MPAPIHSTSRPPIKPSQVPTETLDKNLKIRVHFHLRPPTGLAEKAEDLFENLSRHLPHRRLHLGRSELFERFSATARELDAAAAALVEQGLEVVKKDAEHREVVVEATVGEIEKALDIQMQAVKGRPDLHTFDGPVRLPEKLAKVVDEVGGLDTMPTVTHRSHCLPFSAKHYQVRQVAELYDFPLEQRGAGQTAVILMLGGGFHQEDLELYFKGIGLDVPAIEVDGVNGATNAPASSQAIKTLLEGQGFDTASVPLAGADEDGSNDMTAALWTVEATTDVEILGSLLPEAKIVMIFAPNTQSDQVDAMRRALSPEFEKHYGRPTVISCSWGQYEYTMRESTRDAMEAELKRAAALGVTVCCSSGDAGGGFVYYPASSPYVLACGGTAILTPPGRSGKTELKERVWREQRLERYFSASGGGISNAFDVPDWQKEAVAPWGASKRGIPDLAAQAAMGTGYSLVIGGERVGVGGTSSAAPMVAGLIGQIVGANADLADDYRVGWLTPLLYTEAFADVFQGIGEGSNGLYCAYETWDPCTGLGRPVGSKLLAALRAGDSGASGSKGKS